LDLLYGMCEQSSSRKIVRELLQFLVRADYDIREVWLFVVVFLFCFVFVL
jgi:hypothetical protein